MSTHSVGDLNLKEVVTPLKKRKIDDKEIERAEEDLKDLSKFQPNRILACDSRSKTIVAAGSFCGAEGNAIVVLEKKPLDEPTFRELCCESTILKKEFRNDIYGNYSCFPDARLNALKATVIHPASDKHIKKYETQLIHIINETPELYETVTLPHLKEEQFDLQWVFNILDHTAEADRIVEEDIDPKSGFVLVPDLKWDGEDLKSLYLIALVRPVGIQSLRDLNSAHLPLLRNILEKGTSAIERRYGLSASRLRIFFHYQPSFYHLHVHFTYLQYDAPGIHTERAHLLKSVISNIELVPDYYQRVVLPFPLKESDKLFSRFSDKGVVSTSKKDGCQNHS